MSSILDVWYNSECACLLYRCYLTSRVTLRYLLAFYLWHFRTYSRLIQAYLLLLRHMRTLAYLGTLCFSHSQAYSKRYASYLCSFTYLVMLCFRHIRWYLQHWIYWGIFAHIGTYFNRFIIQELGITGSNNVTQHLLFKSGFSIKSLFKFI